jgi:hypothetical protein
MAAGAVTSIAADLWLDPGAVRVLTRSDATALAGYAPSDYQYGSLQLGNTSGALALYPPQRRHVPVDALTWGAGASLSVQTGASFERVDLAGATWVIATAPWSAQHTDKGSPGAAFCRHPSRRRRPTPRHAGTADRHTARLHPPPTPTARPRAAHSRERSSWSTRSPSPTMLGEFVELTNLDTQPRQPARLDADRRRWSPPHDCRRPVARSRRVLHPHARRRDGAGRLRAIRLSVHHPATRQHQRQPGALSARRRTMLLQWMH